MTRHVGLVAQPVLHKGTDIAHQCAMPMRSHRAALSQVHGNSHEALPSVDSDVKDPLAVPARKTGKPSTKNKQPAAAQPGAH